MVNNPIEKQVRLRAAINQAFDIKRLFDSGVFVNGREWTVSDNYHEPKTAVITGFEILVGCVDKDEPVSLKTQKDIDGLDFENAVVNVVRWVTYMHNGKEESIFYEALLRMNPNAWLKRQLNISY